MSGSADGSPSAFETDVGWVPCMPGRSTSCKSRFWSTRQNRHLSWCKCLHRDCVSGRADGSQSAFETEVGWVPCISVPHMTLTLCHFTYATGDKLLAMIMGDQEQPLKRFTVSLPKKVQMKHLIEFHSRGVQRFKSFKKSMHSWGKFRYRGVL